MKNYLLITSYNGDIRIDEYDTIDSAVRFVKRSLQEIAGTSKEHDMLSDTEYRVKDLNDYLYAYRIVETPKEDALFVWTKQTNTISVCPTNLSAMDIMQNYDGIGLHKYNE